MSQEHLTADWILSPGMAPLAKGRVILDKATGSILALEETTGDVISEMPGTTFLTPGLINSHTHLELFAPSPIPREAQETMADWLLKVIAQSQQRTEADKHAACRNSILELIRTGTTCVNDVSSTGASLEALSQVGMRGIVSLEFFHPGHEPDPDLTALMERYQGLHARFGRHPLLTLGVSPHSPYNVTPQAWAKVIQALEPALVHTHLAETWEEQQWFAKGHSPLDAVHQHVLGSRFGPVQAGSSPVQYIASVLNANTLAAHGVYLSAEDICTLVERGVCLAHCPRSNVFLSGETIRHIQQYWASGLVIGLGTDSRLSCPDLDLRAEGRFARQCHGLSSQEVFEWMTQGSAQAIKHGKYLGRLQPGYAADLVLWQHPATGVADPYEAWLSPETQAMVVWINGRVVLERSPEMLAAWVG